MFRLFHSLADRVQALFLANAGLDFEAEFAARNAVRKAELLREAQVYEQEGLHMVAEELRRHVVGMDMKRPLASVLPSVEHWQAHDQIAPPVLTRQRPHDQDRHGAKPLPLSTTSKQRNNR